MFEPLAASSKISVKKILLERGKAAYPGSPFFWLLFFGEAKKSDTKGEKMNLILKKNKE
ncbi:hypothetical protein [Aggregatibacter kilianii]|uniref:hypothetical protein n=1 Tax=Aggregatibacter kilianii TaxID=2025884 RepID=UPI0013A67FE6|nr:hypothetical protein [Aggregatibacter kilianii]